MAASQSSDRARADREAQPPPPVEKRLFQPPNLTLGLNPLPEQKRAQKRHDPAVAVLRIYRPLDAQFVDQNQPEKSQGKPYRANCTRPGRGGVFISRDGANGLYCGLSYGILRAGHVPSFHSLACSLARLGRHKRPQAKHVHVRAHKTIHRLLRRIHNRLVLVEARVEHHRRSALL